MLQVGVNDMSSIFLHGNQFFGPRGPSGPDGNPVGTILSILGKHAPKDYLICDGSEYQIKDYSELANYFEEEFGSCNAFGGDGESSFRVPDMRNLFLRGYHGGSEEQLSGEIGEKQEGTEIRNVVTGTLTDNGGVYFLGTNTTTFTSNEKADDPNHADKIIGGVQDDIYIQAKATGTHTQLIPFYTARPVNMAVLYCIKAHEPVNIYPYMYSEEEIVIGQWVDGAPVYRKTLNFNLPSDNIKNYVVGMVDPAVKDVVTLKGYVRYSKEGSYNVSKANLPYSYQNSVNKSPAWILPAVIASGALQVTLINVIEALFDCPASVTVEYTKLTD